MRSCPGIFPSRADCTFLHAKGINHPPLYRSHLPSFLQEAPSGFILTFYLVIMKSRGQKPVMESRKAATALVPTRLICCCELRKCTVVLFPDGPQLSGSVASSRVHNLNLQVTLWACVYSKSTSHPGDLM